MTGDRNWTPREELSWLTVTFTIWNSLNAEIVIGLYLELKNNACKLAKWTAQAVLAGVDNLKFGYITRYNVKDSSRHIILGTQQVKYRV